MPIYAYKCAECQHELEVLQKVSDPLRVDCPQCGRPALVKQVTAAGFQLKGSGWYVTDFRDKPAKKETAKGNGKDGADRADGKADGNADSKATDSAAAPAAESKSDKSDGAKKADAPAPAPTPPPASGTS